MNKQLLMRQRIRKALLILTFLSFPITMNYLSPYVIIDGASQGIVNGSLVVFLCMLVGSLFLGRLWCGWVCPAGGLQEMSEPVNRAAVNGRRIDWIKWAVWIPWILFIVWMAVKAGGYHSVDLLLDTRNGISVSGDANRPILYAYIIYYGVIALIFLPAVFIGRRGFCHTICWMAPFMMIGRWHPVRFLYRFLPGQSHPLFVQLREMTCRMLLSLFVPRGNADRYPIRVVGMQTGIPSA
jgi:polyferredoxin